MITLANRLRNLKLTLFLTFRNQNQINILNCFNDMSNNSIQNIVNMVSICIYLSD